MTEDRFPTISDTVEALSELVRQGLGDLPTMLVLVPDSTMQALSRAAGHSNDAQPALMMEMPANGNRLPVSIICYDRLNRVPTAREAVQ